MMTVGLAGIPSDRSCAVSGCLLLVDAHQLQLLNELQTRRALVSSI